MSSCANLLSERLNANDQSRNTPTFGGEAVLFRRLAKLIYRTILEQETIVHRLLVRRMMFLKRVVFLSTVLVFPTFLMFSWIRLGVRLLFGLKPTVLWAPTPILTIVDSSEVLRRQGYSSTTLVFTSYFITDRFDINLKSLIQNPAVGYWLPNVLFLWSLLKFDIYHFFYDGGLWSGMKIVPEAKWLELPFLRLAGKRIIASAYGADVRTKFENERWQPVNICQECPEPGKFCVCNVGTGTLNIKYYRDWCNVLLATGDMHDFVFGSRKDINYWPIDVNQVEFVGIVPHDGPVRLAHSPNHREFKGTRHIEAAIAALQAKGYDVQLDIVEKVSNAEAKRRYAAADVVVAQCLVGWGYTEIEAMAAGKPVVTYLRDPKSVSHMPGCPMVSAHPETLQQQLEKLITQPVLREELGRRGREYVEKYWSYEALGPRYDQLHQAVWRDNRLWKTLKDKWLDFFRGETRYRVGNRLFGKKLEEWAIHSDCFLNTRRIDSGCYGQPPYDEHGLPRMFYNGRYVEHPGVLALTAMNAYHCSLAEPDNEQHTQRFLKYAGSLKDRLQIDENGVGRWYYPFETIGRPGKMQLPWVSCFSQATALSMLLRADQIQPGEGFGESAVAAARLYQVSLEDEGIQCLDEGLTFLEEYPEDPPSHVLNGFITAVLSLHEYWRVHQEEWARSLLDRCIQTLTQVISRYETPQGLRYDLRLEGVVSPDYYYFIVQQLWALHQISGQRVFKKYAHRWTRAMHRQKLAQFVTLRMPL